VARDSGPERARSLCLSLERHPLAPSLARAALEGFTEHIEIEPEEFDTLRLLVSELVSNAVLHSDAPSASAIVLRARTVGRETVRVEVIDRGTVFTVSPRDPSRPTGGYGLFLVARQASRWGVDDAPGTTRVWFEIATGSPAGT
jgi:anti-sigma regulatory factor (Ser/Thr protein kinase)